MMDNKSGIHIGKSNEKKPSDDRIWETNSWIRKVTVNQGIAEFV